MCLAVPMKIIEIQGNIAKVEINGIQRETRLNIIEPKPKVGDYVIIHAGFVINVIDEIEAKITLEYFKELSLDDPPEL